MDKRTVLGIVTAAALATFSAGTGAQSGAGGSERNVRIGAASGVAPAAELPGISTPSSLLGPLDLGTSAPFTSFGRFLPGVAPNASGTQPSPRLPVSALGSTTGSSLDAPSSLRGPVDSGASPPFTSFGRFLPGVGPNASGTTPSPRLSTPSAGAAPAPSPGGTPVGMDSPFCDLLDFTCDD